MSVRAFALRASLHEDDTDATPSTHATDFDNARALPSAPRRLRLGMPHLDVGGLSEGWLFRYAGDLHWEAISQQLGVATHEISDDNRARIYPTVVALRARYETPLCTVSENDVLAATVEVMPCGRACAEGRIAAVAGPAHIAVDLLTTFASRGSDGAMRTALPAARLATRWQPITPPSRLSLLARAARRGERLDDGFAGPALAPAGAPLGRVRHEPSPYTDYNGARLLYFAAYPTIADTAERRLVRTLGLERPGAPDWALATSPVRRDVFYYGNLPLGEAIVAELLAFEPDKDVDENNDDDNDNDTNRDSDRSGSITADARIPRAGRGVKTRVRLRRERSGQPIADVVTRRLYVNPSDETS